LRESGSGTRHVVETRLREHRIACTSLLYVGSTEAIKRLVMAGIGVGWLPRLGITHELRLGTLASLPLAELTIYRPLYRIQHADHQLSRAARAFIECWIDSI
jgi:DNA-binding transcriptional LysR family regulator